MPGPRPGLNPALRSMLGGVVAVALVCLGIVALQVLVPAEKDTPAVVTSPPPLARGTTPAPVRTSAAPSASPSSSSPSPSLAGSPSASPSVAARPPLTVLNNSKVNKLAAHAAEDFARGGWTILGTGNVGGRLAQTTVYYNPGQEAAAAELRRQFPAILAAAPRYAGLPGGAGMTVVVTRDYPHQ
jgi:hypothetical protein